MLGIIKILFYIFVILLLGALIFILLDVLIELIEDLYKKMK